MELALDQGRDRPDLVRVEKILKYANVKPIGVANENPILDSRMYEVKYNDGHTTSLADNLITDNLSAQVDQAGNQFTILDSTARCICAYMNGHENNIEHNKIMGDLYSV